MTTFGFRWHEGPTDIREYPEDSGQSYKTGDPLCLVAGQLRIAASDQLIWGIALQDATGTAGASSGLKQKVHVINPWQVWTAYDVGTSTQAKEGLKYGLTLSAGACYVDTTDTTTVTVVVQQLDPQDGPKAAGKMWVRFLPAVCQAIVGS